MSVSDNYLAWHPPAKRKTPHGFTRYDLALLQINTVVDFDVFIWPDGSAAPVLYRDKNLKFSDEDRGRLIQAGTAEAYIESDKTEVLAQYLERNLDTVITNPSIPPEAKAGILYACSVRLVQDVLDKPAGAQSFKRSENLVRSAIGYILQGKEAVHRLLSLRSYDYLTYTHSVNVCTLGVALAEQVGLKSQAELVSFGIGAVFHDVGKTQMPQSIIRKVGPLTVDELTLMRKHPEMGLSLLDPKAPFSDDSKAVVLEHHEWLDGSGYPQGKRGAAIHPLAKVAAVVDVFDALTTRRVYRRALATFPALQLMKQEVDTHFEPEYYRVFVRMLGK